MRGERKKLESKIGICSCENVIVGESYSINNSNSLLSPLAHNKCRKLLPEKLASEFLTKYKNYDDYYDELK